MKQLTRDEAIAVAKAELWKDMSDEEIVEMQLYQEKVCMPFKEFHKAIEKVLDRPIWTHEFAFPKSLKAEYEKKIPKPNFSGVMKKLEGIVSKENIIIADFRTKGEKK